MEDPTIAWFWASRGPGMHPSMKKAATLPRQPSEETAHAAGHFYPSFWLTLEKSGDDIQNSNHWKQATINSTHTFT